MSRNLTLLKSLCSRYGVGLASIRSMKQGQLLNVAVIGAGLAGATCAQALARAGHAVHLFDKSRGPGGRMATRRMAWYSPEDTRHTTVHTTALDHGAVALTARTPTFHAFLQQAAAAGSLLPWQPRLAPHSLPLEHTGPHWLPTPDGPALCRQLLQGLPATWSCTVDGLHRFASGWQVQAGEHMHPTPFDAVVLALPPAQAAPLLRPHHSDWARHAALVAMQACWTLMGVAAEKLPQDTTAPPFDVLRPVSGPLGWLLRNDARPGRTAVPGQAHWVAHAQPGWSRRHLEDAPETVQQHLQAAVAAALGQPVAWLHSTVHRWRYALPPAQPSQPLPQRACWWQTPLQLGVCGDFLGGHGLEGAWLSAQALVARMTCTPLATGARPATAATSAPTGWPA